MITHNLSIQRSCDSFFTNPFLGTTMDYRDLFRDRHSRTTYSLNPCTTFLVAWSHPRSRQSTERASLNFAGFRNEQQSLLAVVSLLLLKESALHADISAQMTGIHSNGLHIFSQIIGWGYFACWSLSFYPQARGSLFNLFQGLFAIRYLLHTNGSEIPLSPPDLDEL